MSGPLLLLNGCVFTGRADEPWARAVLIDAGRVVAVGDEQVLRDRAPGAPVHDLECGTALPGLIDAHNHALATGEGLPAIDVRALGLRTTEQLVDEISRRAQDLPEGGMVMGSGFRPEWFTGAAPTRLDLDRAAPRHGVVIYHVSGHGALVSSSVLAAAGLDDASPDPPGGSLVRDASGRLTGLVLDNALALVLPPAVDIGAHGPNFHTVASDASLRAAWRTAVRAFHQAGLTTVCDAQVTSRERSAYAAAHADDELGLRVVMMPLSHDLSALVEAGARPAVDDPWLHEGPVKLYADGTLLGGTAVFSEPLCGRSDHGHYFRPVDEIGSDVLRATEAGWRVGIHAIGDTAIDAMLPWLEDAASRHADLRPRIEHAMAPTPDAVRRLASVGGVAVVQPGYLVELGAVYAERLGPERCFSLLPLRDLLEGGVRVVISSDSDVASYRPLDTVSAAITRRADDGPTYDPRHRLTLEEALQAHTSDAAFAIGRERDLGRLAPGYRADLTLLADDVRGLRGDDIRHVAVSAVVLDGQLVAS